MFVRLDEWKNGHVPGARHIFLPELRKRVGELDRKKPTAVYCGSGYRASIASEYFKGGGFRSALECSREVGKRGRKRNFPSKEPTVNERIDARPHCHDARLAKRCGRIVWWIQPLLVFLGLSTLLSIPRGLRFRERIFTSAITFRRFIRPNFWRFAA